MGISKAFGYIVNCDQVWVVDRKEGEPEETLDGIPIPLQEIACDQRLLVLTPSHSEGKYGGEFVIKDAKKNGYLYDRLNKKFACQSCFQRLEKEGKVQVQKEIVG